MSQPVKLSDAIVLDARVTGGITERSIAGQIEYWANIGRAIERLLQGAQALALCRTAAATPLSSCLEEVDDPQGRRRVKDFLKSQPYPHYEPAPHGKGLLMRIEADGTRLIGRFINRKFQAVRTKSARR